MPHLTEEWCPFAGWLHLRQGSKKLQQTRGKPIGTGLQQLPELTQPTAAGKCKAHIHNARLPEALERLRGILPAGPRGCKHLYGALLSLVLHIDDQEACLPRVRVRSASRSSCSTRRIRSPSHASRSSDPTSDTGGVGDLQGCEEKGGNNMLSFPAYRSICIPCSAVESTDSVSAKPVCSSRLWLASEPASLSKQLPTAHCLS